MERGAVEAPTLVTSTSRAHTGEVACADVSACGARLVTGGGDRSLRVWRWAPGAGWEELAVVARAHRYGVTGARWGRGGGALLASCGVDGTVRVWGAGAARLTARRVLAAPSAAAARSLAWLSGGGARLAAGHDDGAVCVWAVPRGELLVRVVAHGGALHALTPLADDALLLTACTDGTIKVFDLVELCSSDVDSAPERQAAPLVWIDGAHDMGVLCCSAAPRGHAVATGGHDACVRVWRVGRVEHAVTLVETNALEGHTAAVTALHWGARDLLASASLDRMARLWEPATSACLHVLAAHPRYLTCIALAPDNRFMVTGSNDKSFRTWTLGAFSLQDEVVTPCNALAHFAVGDLEGIGPVDVDEEEIVSDRITISADTDVGEGEVAGDGGAGGGDAQCAWRVAAHAGAINCVAAQGDYVATASSDGTVKVWSWVDLDSEPETAGLTQAHVLTGHHYPALACHFGAAATVLLTAGLDGAAYLWDVQSGVQVRALSVPGGAAGGGDSGGGGVRDARLSPARPPRALLATDDGLAPLWDTASSDPHPLQVFAGLSEAALCCAWAGDSRACVVGGAGGELRVFAPPTAHALHHDSQAHDLGVTSCDFVSSPSALGLPASHYLLATAGSDSLIKLWTIELYEDSSDMPCVHVVMSHRLEAHGGAVASVRFGVSVSADGALLASAGDDRWARVWRVRVEGAVVRVTPRAAVSVRGAGGALAALPVCRAGHTWLAVGALCGELALWRLGTDDAHGPIDDSGTRFWRDAGVTRWLKDYVTRAPGSRVTREQEAELLARARGGLVTGAALLDDGIEDLLATFGYGEEIDTEEGIDDKDRAERAVVRATIRDELHWLREDPPDEDLARSAPHALLCPLTHALLRRPTCAADGLTYEHDNILEWMRGAPPEGAVSPVSGRRLRNLALVPNYSLRHTLRQFIQQAGEDSRPELQIPTT